MASLSAPDDGPQASTRNVKHRRPSSITSAAQSLASREQRLNAAEKRTSNAPQTPGPQRSIAAHESHVGLRNVNTHYDDLEERLSSIEQRVLALDSNHKPFEAYQQQALDAVQQLREFKKRLQSCGPSKTELDLTKQLHRRIEQYEVNMQAVAGRPNQLEDRVELAKAEQLSTRDLAAALTQRLRRGELLDNATVQALREAMPKEITPPRGPSSVASVPRQQETPTTDSSRSAASATESEDCRQKSSNKVATPVSQAPALKSGAPLPSASRTKGIVFAVNSTAELSNTGPAASVAQASSRKRRRNEVSAPPSHQRSIDRDSKPFGTPQAESALNRFISGASSAEQTPAAKRVRKAVVGGRGNATTAATPDSSLRRTGRKARPVINDDITGALEGRVQANLDHTAERAHLHGPEHGLAV